MAASAGTTASSKQNRSWVFTCNHPTKEEQHAVEKETGIRYAVWQKEQGEAGTPHLQGYIQYKTAKRFSTLKRRYPRFHFEVARGSAEQNRKYCTKEPRLGGPWTVGECPQQGRRTDLEAVADTIKEKDLDQAITDHPTMFIRYHRGMQALSSHYSIKKREERGWVRPRILVFWGDTGTGKTRKAYQLDKTLYSCSSHDNTLWFDGYSGQKTILFDDFKGGIRYRTLLQITGGYPFHAPVKGGFTMLSFRTIIFTSNHHPDDWYPNISTPELTRRLTEFGKIKEFKA